SLNQAHVFIYNGAGMEPWVYNLLESSDNGDLIVVDASNGLELIPAGQNDEEHEHDGEHDHGEYDPHLWLDPILVKSQVDNIRNAFVAADPQNKETYEYNAEEYKKKLDELDMEIKTTMDSCKKRDILITHSTLGYFCKRYGCNQIAITGINAEGEPSAADLVDIINQAKQNNVSAIFLETMLSPESAEIISGEMDVEIVTFNSVHGLSTEEQANGEDYISLMRANLANIKKALQCN
ncbi:zinc ABC transporter substrate-binding protein, partial [Candidatus Micrarchaeota archaeon]|nr:zinc ABC transporter substrate-binding protein [Candidatus Micrarchaeota archaeon]